MLHLSILVILILTCAIPCPSQTPSPTPPRADITQQEKIRTFTEEIVIPVKVIDAQGRFDPSLSKDEILILEDGTPQEIMSVRHIPASVLLLIATAGELNNSMKVNVSKEIASDLVARLRGGDQCSVLQYGADTEIIQAWSDDLKRVSQSIQLKLSSSKGNRLARALSAAVAEFKLTPVGNRHLVLITDGVEDGPEGLPGLKQPIEELLSQGVTIHTISYSRMGRQTMWKSQPLVIVTAKKPRKTAADIVAEMIDPIGSRTEKPKLRLIVDTDIQMRLRRYRYLQAMEEGERLLSLLALETAGLMSTPRSVAEMKLEPDRIVQYIDSQYVVTYKPKRPLASAQPGEYRQIEVAPRRVGLIMSTRRGYVVSQIN